MDLRELDLNLLVTFAALMREASVTEAGRKLGVSQPAISYALAKLRRTFGDPLFVRVRSRMQPTARAQALGTSVARVVDLINAEVLQKQRFDPAGAIRTLSLCMSDVGEANFVSPLLREIMANNPGIDVRVQSLPAGDIMDAMAAGSIDLAVGYYPDLKGQSVLDEKLFESGFVCVARRGNPYVRGRLTLRRFAAAPHVALRSGARTQGFIERDLRSAGIQPRARVTVQHFMSLVDILPKTDLIAVVPLESAQLLGRAVALEIRPLPYRSSRFAVKEYWHRRYHRDPVNQWIRAEIKRLLQRPESRGGSDG